MERMTDQIGALMRDFGAQLSGWLGSLNWSDVILAAAIVLIVVALRSFLARWTVWLVIAVGNSIGVIIAETVKTAITPAIKTLIVAFALLIALEIIDLPETIYITLERILISVAIASVFAVAYVLTGPLSKLLEPYRTTSTQIQVDWILGIAKVAVVFLGIAAVLEVCGCSRHQST